MHYISNSNLFILLERLKANYQVYLPIKRGEQRLYAKYSEPSDEIVIGEVRPFEPLKAFFTRSREIVAQGFKDDIPCAANKPYCIVGVKNCDLRQGFKVQDHVFKDHDYKDPFYIKHRQDNLIIAADCTCAIDTCFCLAAGNQPYPESNFDIGLSPIKEGFIVEAASKKGEDLIKNSPLLFQEATKRQLTQKEKQREKVTREVEKNIEENNIPSQKSLSEDIIEKNYESEIWEDQAKACVECGACTIICPTCHCFLLYDQKSEEKMARLRIWDSCMVKDYARVAGGANPRPKLHMRLRNRFEKKFDFFPKVAQFHACTGCGRCISACPAKIDIREVLKKLVDNVSK